MRVSRRRASTVVGSRRCGSGCSKASGAASVGCLWPQMSSAAALTSPRSRTSSCTPCAGRRITCIESAGQGAARTALATPSCSLSTIPSRPTPPRNSSGCWNGRSSRCQSSSGGSPRMLLRDGVRSATTTGASGVARPKAIGALEVGRTAPAPVEAEETVGRMELGRARRPAAVLGRATAIGIRRLGGLAADIPPVELTAHDGAFCLHARLNCILAACASYTIP
mmetsp:Transcript_91132/g.195446  ORF Transcript_91132/g.195446 Transcript_91132/m.195446 type:complete len:224 (+) Transcript_91132:953-1624(+)